MKKFTFAHPFIFALYPIVFLFANNLKEYRLGVLLIPSLIAFLFAAFIFLISKLIFKRVDAAAIVASVVIFTSLSYTRLLLIAPKLQIKMGDVLISHESLIIGAIIIAIGFTIFAVRKYKKALPSINKALFVISLVLIIFSLIKIVAYEVKSGRTFREETAEKALEIREVKNSDDLPDIYYIIFDRYAGAKSLKEQYGFDNSKVLNFLKDKGFYLPENPTTNYPKTFLSLASSLNFEYMDYLTEQTDGGTSSDESIVTPILRNNKAVEFLKGKGYKYVHLGSWWAPTAANKNADITYALKKGTYAGADEFTTGFLNTTIAASFLKQVFRDPMDVSENPVDNDHRRRMFFEFDSIQKASLIPGPKFVFMHILAPHDPFVVDEKCQPISEKIVKKKKHQENYINQVKCVNTKLEEMVNVLLSKSKNPPIIILQADEGPFPMNVPLPKNESWGTADTVSLKEKFPIFSAYYFPERETEGLYGTITPVNSFRVLFNTYFGTNYPLLPDRNYVFQDDENYYKFIDVTDRVK